MGNDNARFCKDNNRIFVRLPLTQATGKIRIKERNSFSEYGVPVATRRTPLSLRHYVEWMIGYDIPLKVFNEDKSRTLLGDFVFANYKNEKKVPYELAEIAYYSLQMNLIGVEDIKKAADRIRSDSRTLDAMDEMQISRTNPMPVRYNDVDFYQMKVSYPLAVHKFGKYDIYAEIINRENQKAAGVQPLLCVCLPITSMEFSENPLGRVLASKECANWIIDKDEAMLSLELIRIFGMLSEKHRFDMLAILHVLFGV